MVELSIMIHKRHNTAVRQKQIIAAVRKLIVRYGSEHVTVRRIAKEIKVTEGAIYKHFKSKRDVLSFLIDDIENTLMADIDNNYSGKLNNIEQLEAVVSGHLSSIEQRKGISFQVIAEIISLGDKRLNKKIYNVINRYIGRIGDIIWEGANAGILRPDVNPNAAATLFFGMLQGLVNIWALSNYSFNLQERYAELWETFRDVIAKR